MELAELAANEQDSEKLLALVAEINQLLDKKQTRLNDVAATARAETERQKLPTPAGKTDPNNPTDQS